MNITIDKDGCISCGICVDMCPDVYQFGDDGLAEVVAAPTEENASTAKEAAESCPVAVIHVKD